VLAIGIVVDDAIVVLENVERIMHEEGLPARLAAMQAMREVTGPVVAIVLVLCAVFVPIAFLGGLTGELYRQFAVTISIAVVISGIVALTLTPSLCVLILKSEHKAENRLFRAFNRGFGHVTTGYTRGVAWLIRRGGIGLILFGGMVAIAFGLWKITPGSLVPEEDQGYYITAVFLPDGASLERTDRIVHQVDEIIRQDPNIKSTVAFTGFDFLGGSFKNNAATIFVTLKHWDERSVPADALVGKTYATTGHIKEALVLSFNPPAIFGLGNAGGFEFYLQNRGEGDAKRMGEVSQQFLGAVHGRDLRSRAALALDAQGRILALRIRSEANVGAYATPTGVAIQLLVGPWVQTSVYAITTIDFEFQAVLTNTTPTGAYRGAGRPEAIYLIERLIDAAAHRLALDPVELRRRNLIAPQRMPYRNPMGQVYDSGHFESMLEQALALADWDGFDARLAESKARGRLRGRGLVTFLEWTGGNALEERVTVDVTPDGYIEIASATQAMGQGIATSYAQLAVDVFQVPIDRIRIVQGDTDRATGFGSAGSRSLFTGGSAVQVASQKTVRKAQERAAEHFETRVDDVEYREGAFRIVGTDRSIGLFELAGREPARRIAIDSTTAVDAPSWPNACHVSEVEIDPDTGEVEVVAYSSMNDVGRVVNPTIVRGQLEGGAMQGIGQALCEGVVYEADSGQLLSASFLDYALPRAQLAPPFRMEMDPSIPCRTNPLGVKGVGELGTIGATPCVFNAVVDALWRAGAGERALALQMPLTAERVWGALRGEG
jgi:hypothetical protein